MIANYVKTSYRNLLKSRSYTIINVFGLTIGAAASLLIFMYVWNEWGYDNFFEDNDRIYRVVIERQYPDYTSHFAIIPAGFSTVFAEEIPEIESSARLIGFPNFASTVRYENVINSEYYIFSADSNFFQIFDFELLKGDPQTALKHPNTIILTEGSAEKYFGSEDPMGKVMQIDGNNLEVAGVMEDIPENSHLKFDMLSSSTNVGFLQNPSFYISGTYTYVKLKANADYRAAESKIPAMVEKYAAGQIERNLGLSYREYTDAGNGYFYSLQPLKSIHLHSNLSNEITANGSITYVRMLIFVGLLILLIAGINFVNLATARSAGRAKEVGIRKVLGSLKRQLIIQFLSESVLLSFASLFVASITLIYVLGYFNELISGTLDFTVFLSIKTFWILLVTMLFGLMAGLYPAFYLSALKPVKVMQGKFRHSEKGTFLRKALIIFQYSISVVLIASTMTIYRQFQYIESKDLGFEKENVLVINNNGQTTETDPLKEELRNIPGVLNISATNSNPGGYFFGLQFRKPGSSEIYTTKGLPIDDHYLNTLGMRIVEGRGFRAESNDSLNVILNESAVKALGYADPVGSKLINALDTLNSTFTIIGVAVDFNYESLKTEIAPMIMVSLESQYGFFSRYSLRIDPDLTEDILSQVESSWKLHKPEDAFIYSFLDETLSNQYQSDHTSGKLLGFFTLVAILIACVGLFGLAAYTISQRTKEIGIRKVLGASFYSVIYLLFKDFGKFVAISILIGSPVAFFMMQNWLENFAYRTSVNAAVFAFAGLLLLFITILTIGYQSIRAALVNPSKSLRSE